MTPQVSIVIPVLGRYDQLAETIGRLGRQTCSADSCELIVVSDAAEADPERIGAVASATPLESRHLCAPVPGAASARETGWRDARASLVLFLDSDVLGDPQLVAEHLAWHARHPEPEVAVLGPLRWASRLKITGFMRWAERFQFKYHEISGEEAGWGHYITANVSSKKAMLERAGGFDFDEFPFHYEDIEIAYRMRAQGLRILFNRAASAEHLHSVTLTGYRERVAAIAPAEHRFVDRYPELEPYYYRYFSDAIGATRSRGVFGRLLGRVRPTTPLIGAKVWRSADAYYRQQLAPSFLNAWEAAEVPR